MNERVNGGDDEGDDGCGCVDASVGALVGLIHYPRELKSAGQHQSQVLVEDNRVEDEEMALDKGDPQVPPDDVVLEVAREIAAAEQHVEEEADDSEDQEGDGDVVDITEEADVGVVLLEV